MISNNVADSDEHVQPSFKLRNYIYCRPVAEHSQNIQATCKGSDQTALMGRLVGAFCWSHILTLLEI